MNRRGFLKMAALAAAALAAPSLLLAQDKDRNRAEILVGDGSAFLAGDKIVIWRLGQGQEFLLIESVYGNALSVVRL